MSTDSDSSSDEAHSQTRHSSNITNANGIDQLPGMGKRKKRKHTTSARGPTALPASRGTGFEEYFADPPITPTEAEEERLDIYAPDLPFSQRIESCIQRFRSRRRLTNLHSHFFNEYLLLGGVDCSPNAFTGIDQRELRKFTPAEQRELRAVDGIHSGGDGTGRFYDGDDEHWSVDFTAIAQGFLSVSIVSLTGLEAAPLEVAITIVQSFLRYVLQHDVCPEYEEDINGALDICQKARQEWPLIKKLHALLPGRLNDAAAQLFQFRDKDDWAKVEHIEDESSEDSQPQGEISAKATVFTALALLEGEELMFQKLVQAWQAGNIATRHVNCAIKLESIHASSEDTRDRFSRLQLNESHIPTIGKATFTRTIIKDGWDKVDASGSDLSIPDKVSVYMDDRILKKMVPGMKMNATLVEIVDVGIFFLKKAGPILPSFYRFLPQELMKRYREPREMDQPPLICPDS